MRWSAVVACAVFAVACSGSPNYPSPISPATVSPSGESLATLAVRSFTMPQTATGYYVPQVAVQEMSGLSGATLTNVSFHLNGQAAGFLPGNRRVPAGGTLQMWGKNAYGDYDLELSGRSDTVEVFFVDDEGRSGSVKATVSP
jgi:hypothetical protein